MNLIENEQQLEKNKKANMLMLIIIVCIILLIVLSAVILYMIQNVQNNTTKLTIDTKQIAKFSEDMFLFENGTTYISIRDFAELVGYKGYKGDYTSEGITKGYIQNNFEEASYTLNSNRIYKKLANSNDNEYYNIEQPVKIQNDKLYMSIDGVRTATNCSIAYNEENKTFTVYTLPYLVQLYGQAIEDAAIIGENASYSNQKALLYNMVVVRTLDVEGNLTGNYGVKKTDGTEIIGTKYKNIKFIESTQEFIVTTENNKMGTVSATGVTKIPIAYDEIRQIDKNLNLYLVKNNNKYGVINQTGNIVIYLEYDQIGVDITQFGNNENSDIKNQYLLFDNCIPVQRDKKWGFFDKTGKQIVEIKYDELGCIRGTQGGTSIQNLLIIPEYEAIVVGNETKNGRKYGLVNSLGQELIACVLDTMYSVTSSGQRIYWMEQVKGEGTTAKFDIVDWLQKNGRQKPIKQTEGEAQTNTIGNNEVTNEIIDNISQNTMSNNIEGNIIANGTNMVPQTGNNVEVEGNTSAIREVTSQNNVQVGR